jgi:glycosyltransferase involved in cell wall biosynthesis
MPPGPFNRVIGSILSWANWVQLSLSTHVIGYTEDYCKSTWVGKLYQKTPSKFSFILPPVPEPVISTPKATQVVKKEHDFYIGYAGRVATEKGLEVLIQAIAEMQKTDQKSRYSLQIAGPYGKDVAGEDVYMLKIQSLLEKYVVKHHFFGTLSGAALTSFYKSLDVFVLPSINQTEAFGMVQVDAMKCGVPVVVSNLPGVRVPVQLTGMGIVVEPQDENALSEAILHILKNRGKYTNAEMLAKVPGTFSFSQSIDAIRNIISQSLVARS